MPDNAPEHGQVLHRRQHTIPVWQKISKWEVTSYDKQENPLLWDEPGEIWSRDPFGPKVLEEQTRG